MDHSFRAPSQHGQAVIEPPLGQAPKIIERNQKQAEKQIDQGDSFLGSIREPARSQMISDAKRYTSAYRDVSWVDERLKGRQQDEAPIIMAGHQPTIFHPGVWFKNFALDDLARKNNAIPINLVIDNDVSAGCSIRVPSIDTQSQKPKREVVYYDRAGGGVPYEQTEIRDRKQFDSFDQLVTKAVGPLVANPCVGDLWIHARAAIERCGFSGCAMAQARHGLEDEVGLQTLELPLGVLCRGSAFAEFALSILTDLPKFCEIYNSSADHYRRENGIRSSAHPVSNLQEQSGWHESPFWVYGNDSPERRPVWAKNVNGWLLLTDNVEGVDEESRTAASGTRLIAIESSHRMLAAEKLSSLVTSNFKLRPRALVTTMYARLVLSDLFLHGIGGGKYDQLGDEIMQQFFGVVAPEFMVISATIQLPESIRQRTESIDDLREQRRQTMRSIRDTRFQPERFAGDADLDRDLLSRKRQLLEEDNRDRQWHDAITAINRTLSNGLSQVRDQLRMTLSKIDDEIASAQLLGSREHPFAVFPLEYLQAEYRKLLG